MKFVRSPFWPASLSGLIVPGLGQFYNRDYSKGVLLLVASFGALLWFTRTLTNQLSLLLPGTPDQWEQDPMALKEAVLVLVKENPGMFFTFHMLILVVWVFSIVDAYLSARSKKRKIPVPSDEISDN